MASTHFDPHSVGSCPLICSIPMATLQEHDPVDLHPCSQDEPHWPTPWDHWVYLQADSGRVNILTSYFRLYSIILMLLSLQLSCTFFHTLLCHSTPFPLFSDQTIIPLCSKSGLFTCIKDWPAPTC